MESIILRHFAKIIKIKGESKGVEGSIKQPLKGESLSVTKAPKTDNRHQKLMESMKLKLKQKVSLSSYKNRSLQLKGNHCKNEEDKPISTRILSPERKTNKPLHQEDKVKMLAKAFESVRFEKNSRSARRLPLHPEPARDPGIETLQDPEYTEINLDFTSDEEQKVPQELGSTSTTSIAKGNEPIYATVDIKKKRRKARVNASSSCLLSVSPTSCERSLQELPLGDAKQDVDAQSHGTSLSAVLIRPLPDLPEEYEDPGYESINYFPGG